MHVALVQFASTTDSTVNLAAIQAMLGGLGPDDGLDLVVLPEGAMHDFGRPDDDLGAIAEALDGPFVQLLAAHARRLGATVVGGMFEATDGLPFNTLVALGPDGTLLRTYRKIHLYDSFGYRESDRLSAGPTEPLVVEVGGFAVGLMTCYDLRFPELARALVDRGAELLLVPAAWVAGPRKVEHWRTLLRARAIENTVFVAAAGQPGPRYSGHSLVVDPLGDVLAEAGDGEEVLTATLDRGVLAEARRTNPSLANRRL